MSRRIPFVRMAGSGNDFVVVDNRQGVLAEGEPAAFARRVCPRAGGQVGADGVLLLEPARARGAGFRMRIFNADGSEAEMCGNGGRCLVRFAEELGLAPPGGGTFETLAGPIRYRVTGPDRVRIGLTPPSAIVRHPQLEFAGRRADVHLVNTGVPHAVVLVEDLDALDLRQLGRALRRHPAFGKAGANADFVRRAGEIVHVRTYERGVEDETLACGTGAVAAALVAVHILGGDGGLASPVCVRPRSGEELLVHYTGKGPRFAGAELEGPVTRAGRGEAEI